MSKKTVRLVDSAEVDGQLYLIFGYDDDEDLLEFDIKKEGETNVKLNESS